MNMHRHSHAAELGVGLIAAFAVTLLLVGIVAAQSQLPGEPLTTDPKNDLRPAWSPDAKQIAFFSTRSGNNDIWVMDADGGNQRQLTNDPADDRRPAWSPDGKYIAFDSDRAGNRDIWMMDADGGNQRQLTNGTAEDTFPSWSPDGSEIAFYSLEDGVLDIWVADASQDNLRRVTNDLADVRRNQCTFACHVPAWSPDGTRIAYQAKNHTQIWIVKVDGSDPIAITDGKTHAHFPWWTSDGRILFLSEHVLGTGGQELANDVWVMDADGQNPVLLFPNIPHGGPFYWSPDGSMKIAFHSPRSGNFDIYTVTLGQDVSTPQPMNATPMVDTVLEGSPTLAPAAVVANPTAVPTTGESTNLPSPALLGALAVIALGGVVLVIYLARKGRSS